MDLHPRLNVWFEREGEVVTSRWRVRLLESIDREGSISAGARAMDVPYRVAWQKVHEMEERLGLRLLETQTGGTEGGGARLTEDGRDHVERMRRFVDLADRAVEQAYGEVFGRGEERSAGSL
jgi:molybdate transport system regulatory protein